jgi:enamine deaminase RidA (YjgF/YER057c/UK114 family)
MPGLTARLAELGLALPPVVTPVAAYVPAVLDGDRVWTSGQLPMIDGALPAAGKVGAGIEPDQAAALARQCALNALAAATTVVDLDRITRVIKLVGFVSSAPDFTGQPQVINGASELLGQLLPDAGGHARSAVGVAVLPMDAPVEVEVVFGLS